MTFIASLSLIGICGAAPVSASGISDKVSLDIDPVVIAKPVRISSGEQTFLVASNAPFQIISENYFGEIYVNVQVTGAIGGVAYGRQAQLPGPQAACQTLTSIFAQPIYSASTRTAANPGDPIDQAVLITVTYAPGFNPDLSIEPVDQSIMARTPGDCVAS